MNMKNGVKTALIALDLAPRIFKEGFLHFAERALTKQLDNASQIKDEAVRASAMKEIAKKFEKLGEKSWRQNKAARSKAVDYLNTAAKIYTEFSMFKDAAGCHNLASEKAPDLGTSLKHFNSMSTAKKLAELTHYGNLMVSPAHNH